MQICDPEPISIHGACTVDTGQNCHFGPVADRAGVLTVGSVQMCVCLFCASPMPPFRDHSGTDLERELIQLKVAVGRRSLRGLGCSREAPGASGCGPLGPSATQMAVAAVVTHSALGLGQPRDLQLPAGKTHLPR